MLSPLRKGPAGVQALNVRLQALLNPPQPGRVEISMGSAVDQQPQILRLGDRVIQVCSCSFLKDCPMPGSGSKMTSRMYIPAS